MNFLQKLWNFIRHPTHTRTMGLIIMLVLVSAVSLTVIAAQQQQQIRQRAADNCTEIHSGTNQTCSGRFYSYDESAKTCDFQSAQDMPDSITGNACAQKLGLNCQDESTSMGGYITKLCPPDSLTASKDTVPAPVPAAPASTSTSATGTTIECSQDADCDDNNPCTADSCSWSGTCTRNANIQEGISCSLANGSFGFCKSGACTLYTQGGDYGLPPSEACTLGDQDSQGNYRKCTDSKGTKLSTCAEARGGTAKYSYSGLSCIGGSCGFSGTNGTCPEGTTCQDGSTGVQCVTPGSAPIINVPGQTAPPAAPPTLPEYCGLLQSACPEGYECKNKTLLGVSNGKCELKTTPTPTPTKTPTPTPTKTPAAATVPAVPPPATQPNTATQATTVATTCNLIKPEVLQPFTLPLVVSWMGNQGISYDIWRYGSDINDVRLITRTTASINGLNTYSDTYSYPSLQVNFSYRYVVSRGNVPDPTALKACSDYQNQLSIPVIVIPSSGNGGSNNPNNIFQCKSFTGGTNAGNYDCAPIINGSAQCSSLPGGNWTESSRSFTSCDSSSSNSTTRVCCKQNTTTPINSVTLALTLNAQDLPSAPDPLPVGLTLYSLTTNSPVPGAPATQSFAKTAIAGKQYSANVALTNLQPDKYFIVTRKDNMIAKAVFAASTANQTIAVPTTTLVFGDINNDNDINALDYNAFKECWTQTTKTPACILSSDLYKSETIDQIDFNTLMRGWATWKTEGK